LKNKSYLVLDNSSFNADSDGHVISTCESSIKFKNNYWNVKRTCSVQQKGSENDCRECLEGGKYKIINNKLLKQ
jgi:hypothetical protein